MAEGNQWELRGAQDVADEIEEGVARIGDLRDMMHAPDKATFDQAVRREIGRLLPGRSLTPLAADHPLFHAIRPSGDVQYTPAVQKLHPELAKPTLEGIAFDGDWRVIYSPYDLSGAWLGCDYPLARGYETQSGSELGMNVLFYAMTH